MTDPNALSHFRQFLEGFSKKICWDCDNMITEAQKLRQSTDEDSFRTVENSVNKIKNIIWERESQIRMLVNCVNDYIADVRKIQSIVQDASNDAYAYAGTVRNIQRMSEWKKEHKNTPKEKAVATIGVLAANLETVRDGIQVFDAVLEGVDLATGWFPNKPPMEPIINVLDTIIDNDTSRSYCNTSVSQEQIDSHTLVIDDASEPWKSSNED